MMSDYAILVAQEVVNNIENWLPGPDLYVFGRNLTKIPRTETSLQKKILEISSGCEVCALGACFLASIKLFGKIKPNEVISYADDSYFLNAGWKIILPRLVSYFTEQNLCIMECTYTCSTWQLAWYKKEFLQKPILKRAIRFGQRFTNETSRLLAIMQNVINNKGQFII